MAGQIDYLPIPAKFREKASKLYIIVLFHSSWHLKIIQKCYGLQADMKALSSTWSCPDVVSLITFEDQGDRGCCRQAEDGFYCRFHHCTF